MESEGETAKDYVLRPSVVGRENRASSSKKHKHHHKGKRTSHKPLSRKYDEWDRLFQQFDKRAMEGRTVFKFMRRDDQENCIKQMKKLEARRRRARSKRASSKYPSPEGGKNKATSIDQDFLISDNTHLKLNKVHRKT
ncbi:uncharacterized protein LOC106670434 [Cimex lectularius]|uniref:Uncharacterized protein n=1 Tax=Cimex lectularius TaxID=79782 RepID=A0A8I6SI39_CIMLE|nr:uncharacterized protein LOC106670434 [Cimex lectularius]